MRMAPMMSAKMAKDMVDSWSGSERDRRAAVAA